MPELPEVETIKRHLAPLLTDNQIKTVLVRRADAVGYPDIKNFRTGLEGKKIKQLVRRGKYLIIHLHPHGRLIFHLRLSGHLRVVENNDEIPAYERVRLVFTSGRALSFIEPRVLGKVYYVDGAGLPSVLQGLGRLGLEPIDRRFNGKYLREKLRGRRAKIKSLLMDQRICAGVGNIYSDEALFRAKIRPTRRANTLKPDEINQLAQALRAVLKSGIKWMGTTMTDNRYLQPDGARGEFQNQLRVFGKKGMPCGICGRPIKRLKLGNRSSYFCPRCQH
ncbi:MAG: bifunctional DNA-formamidopyrimidine glycosylase/DNA-(apurinic or apyrimidinic site) lyase [candidate division WOR-3 bacterium]|nr:bifunctional DNA-formamidopyrimidine glycosylase/DNA-(apurinic or apyrimidinic site) lyase [candidate division WOR-3 bacterium]